MYDKHVYPFLQQIHFTLARQAEKITRLEERLRLVEQEITRLKEQKPISVERIEYKFDQLKVETLQGTLHIGIIPQQGQDIGELAVNGQEPIDPSKSEPFSMQLAESFASVQSQIADYLNEQGHGCLKQFEDQYRLILGEELKRTLMEDLKNQTNARIFHYFTQAAAAKSHTSPKDLEQAVIARLKKEISDSLEQYFRNMAGKEGSS